MRVKFIKFLFTILTLILLPLNANAIEFDVLVLPTGLFSVCDNYFCFPEASNIVAEDVISHLNGYKNIHAKSLKDVRTLLNQSPQLKSQTENMLISYETNDKIDFQTLKVLSNTFNVKSIALISSYTVNDRSGLKRNLWNILELSSAFRFTYPFELKINALLTDNVNGVVMWSNKYSKSLSNSNGYFSAINQAQAISQLEKIKDYSKNNVSQNISQNIHLRFFPKEVRTFSIVKEEYMGATPAYTPNALEKLSEPRLQRELESRERQIDYSSGDDIFSF